MLKYSFVIIILMLSVAVKGQDQHDFLLKTELNLRSQNIKNIFLRKTSHSFNYGRSELNRAVAQVIPASPPDLTLFSNFGNNILNSFKGNNLYLHLAGIASTVLIVEGNIDYQVHNYFYNHENLGNLASPIIHMGTLLPFVVGGSLYAYGKLGQDDEALGASFAVLQASLIEFMYNSLLKAVTGRPNPDWQHNKDMKSLSKTFRFGFNRGGIFWGWPSGHTSTTMAVVSALTNFYPDKTWLKIVGYSTVAYMMFGVSSFHRGGMHWFSDAVAAAFMAYAVGSTVGKFYRSKFTSNKSEDNSLMKVEAAPVGIGFSIQF